MKRRYTQFEEAALAPCSRCQAPLRITFNPHAQTITLYHGEDAISDMQPLPGTDFTDPDGPAFRDALQYLAFTAGWAIGAYHATGVFPRQETQP